LDLVEKTHWDRCHRLHIKRTHNWINQHSPAVLKICRLNCDFKIGDPSSDSRAWRFYTTKYRTKIEKNKAMMFCLAAAIIRFNRRVANDASILPYDLSQVRRKIQMLESLFFEANKNTDVTAIEVNRTLADSPDYYNSHDYRTVNFKLLLASQSAWYNQDGFTDTVIDQVRKITRCFDTF
jgi:hypothetical protein